LKLGIEKKEHKATINCAGEDARMIFRIIPSPVFMVDRDNIIAAVNDRFCQVTGYSSDEVVGKRCTEYFFEPCCENCDLFMNPAHGFIIGRECKLKARDGRVLTVSKNAVLLRNERGQIAGAIESFEDITETLQAEGKRRQLVEELESVNRELGDFAYIISHDLKAPLRGIATLAEWISSDYSDKFDEQGKDQLRLLLSRVKKMHNMIDGVLQYSRVGRIKEDKQPVNLNEVVSEVTDIINPPPNIRIEVAKELPLIEFEPTRIKQVFQNLLSNAVKYIDKPEGRIRISYEDEGSFLKFSIEDNGCGIKQEHYERIFQIFQTVGQPDKSESTGIGLTVVKKIVELYGGKIWVTSKFGEGSAFCFTLLKSEVGVKSDEEFKAHIAG
jgi:PAS domain S-box-containing protein